MSRTTNEFGGGEIVPAIEAITGIQAPVMADFDTVPNGTVLHEHGQVRQIQKLTNNLKSHSGIERIPFNGIDELDTEQGPAGQPVHALNTGDSRIRFVGSGWQVSTSGTKGTVVQTLINNDYVEITFFGTALNLLIFLDNTTTYDWRATVDGGTESGSLRPTNPSDVLKGNRKTNVILPITSGLTAKIHTVRVRNFNNGAGTDGFTVYGCEVINENAAITQQRGADFDGRVTVTEIEAQNGFPIEPTVATAGTAYRPVSTDVRVGARVLNYATSSGTLKQSFTTAVENITPSFDTQEYTIQLNNGGNTSVTVPASTVSMTVNAYGPGGGGASARGSVPGNVSSGASGGGAGRGTGTFTRSSGAADTLTVVIPVGGTAGSQNTLTGVSGGVGGGGSGVNTTVTASGGTVIATGGFATGGATYGNVSSARTPEQIAAAKGKKGTGSTNELTGWSLADSSDDGDDGLSQQNTASGAQFGLKGGNVAGDEASPLVSGEGLGGAGATDAADPGDAGTVPGAGGGSGGASASTFGAFSSAGGDGANGRVYIVIIAGTGLNAASFGVTAVTELTNTGAVQTGGGGAAATFGNTDFIASRRNQEVIRRINYSEFGANNQFAIGGNGVSAAFTLDDGTTTLVGSVLNTFTACVVQNGGFATLTFVGTGLDIYGEFTNINSTQVDGLSIGNFTDTQTGNVIVPIVSGLAYGTHTVRFSNSGNTGDIAIRDFIIYGPKKPEIPTLDAGSLELSDYNIMADFVADTANNINSMSTGILGKAVSREVLLTQPSGGWSTGLSTGSNYGLRLNETGDGSTREELFYTFYGDAFSMRMKSNTANSASNHEFFLDGTQITRTNTEGWDVDEVIFLNNTNNGTSDPSQTWPATGDVTRFDGSDTTKIIFPPSFNMGLGVHTIRIRHAANSPGIFYGMEIGTPIHINDDTLKVGSEGLNNLTIDPIVEEDEQQVLNLGEAKAWINFDITTSSTINSSHNISAVIRASDSTARYYFDKPFKDSNYVVISTIFDTNNSPAATVLEQRANYVAINASLSGNEKQYIVCFGELIDE